MEQANTSSPNAANEKTLVLVRHAKSSWDSDVPSDFERPLNERGKRDAPEMAKRLKERLPLVDAFVSSPAERARKTAGYFAETYGKSIEDVALITKLYHADADIFFDVAVQLSDAHHHVVIFSHNPGITEFVNMLSPKVRIDEMPTSGIFAVRVHTHTWANFKKAPKSFLFFDYPKLVV